MPPTWPRPYADEVAGDLFAPECLSPPLHLGQVRLVAELDDAVDLLNGARTGVVVAPPESPPPCQNSFTIAELPLCVRYAALRYSLIRPTTARLRSIRAVLSIARPHWQSGGL
jgi:hypothetical protein